MKDIKNKGDAELKNLAHEKRNSLRDFRFGVAGSKVRNTREGRNLRKDIARIEGELSSRNK